MISSKITAVRSQRASCPLWLACHSVQNNLFVIIVMISAEDFSLSPPFISNASEAIIPSITMLTCSAAKSSNGSSSFNEKVLPSAHLKDMVNFVVTIASPP